MVFDLGGGVVPGKNGVFRSESDEGDEVLGLGYVQRLLVNAWRHADDRSGSVSQWYRVHCLLHRPEIPAAVLRHRLHQRHHVCTNLMVEIQRWVWNVKNLSTHRKS